MYKAWSPLGWMFGQVYQVTSQEFSISLFQKINFRRVYPFGQATNGSNISLKQEKIKIKRKQPHKYIHIKRD